MDHYQKERIKQVQLKVIDALNQVSATNLEAIEALTSILRHFCGLPYTSSERRALIAKHSILQSFNRKMEMNDNEFYDKSIFMLGYSDPSEILKNLLEKL